MQSLPIDPLLPQLVQSLRDNSRLVLRAPPGAGKTTRVPAALLDANIAPSKRVLVLEPRRIAARSAAAFVARERGKRVGDEIGYRVRFEQQGGAATRLWFLTEGVLGRQLARDPYLEGVGVVVLDEFHERHVHGDIALAVVRELQETVRPDLRLLVMSATLDTDRLAAFLGDCPVVTSEGRAYPVQIEHEAASDDRPLAGQVAGAFRRLLASSTDDGGDVLIFLPGAAEIRRSAAEIAPIAAQHQCDLVLLHGDLPLDAQQRAIRPGPRRKVVLSTNVAESALTIEGVTAVIDSGLARVARFDAKHGINAVRIAPISRASADQRAGRAGRLAPGRCVRLWSAADHAARRVHETPEILRLDLSDTLLELRAWGQSDPRVLAWLDPPDDAAWRRARKLLELLGALAPDGALTPIGRRMLDLAVAPRLARVLIEAEQRNCADAGALLAALASDRDIVTESRAVFAAGARRAVPASVGASDLLLRADLFNQAAEAHFDPTSCRALRLDVRSVRAVERSRVQLSRSRVRGRRFSEVDEDTLLRCVLAGFPDRVVKRRAPGSPRGIMVGGKGVALSERSIVRDAEYFVAIEMEAGRQQQAAEARVHIASAVHPEWLAEMFPAAVRSQRRIEFDDERERVVERRQEVFHDLVLSERVEFDVDPERAGEVLTEIARGAPERAVNLTDGARSLLERVRLLGRALPELDLPADIDALLTDAAARLCAGCRSFADVRRRDVSTALREQLTPRQLHALDREAPTQYRLPSGRAVAVRYEPDKPPSVAARIQELFGLATTPRFAAGRVPLVIQLLAPNQRPVQITGDLASFWRNTYPEVRKQLRGRYPKHAWPEDPLSATPTSRTERVTR